MIQFRELLSKTKPDAPLTEDIRSNLYRLHFCLNVFRRIYKQTMIITSGFRTISDHERIYAEINARRVALGKAPMPIPVQSCHLIGGAADIADSDGALKKWVLENLQLSEELGIYYEEFDSTPDWVHVQIYPPASGKRFFKP